MIGTELVSAGTEGVKTGQVDRAAEQRAVKLIRMVPRLAGVDAAAASGEPSAEASPTNRVPSTPRGGTERTGLGTPTASETQAEESSRLKWERVQMRLEAE
jgi:hypothetical protein